MSRRTGSWLGGFLLGGAEEEHVDRFSLDNLRYLRDVLIRNPVVTDANRDAVVETLRSIAELMVWGDQHDPRFLDYFLENNLLQHFTQILQQRANRRGEVAIQVLQTLSMLIQVASAPAYNYSQLCKPTLSLANLYESFFCCSEHSEQDSCLLHVQQ